MKKTILILILVFSGTITFAQTVAGKTGFLGLSGAAVFKEGYSDFALHTRGGLFVVEKLNVGLELEFSHSRRRGQPTFDTWGAGPFLRYYISGESFTPFIGFEGSYGVIKVSNRNTNYKSIFYGPDLGVNYFLSATATLEILLNYQFMSVAGESRADGSDTSINFDEGLVLEIGISIFL